MGNIILLSTDIPNTSLRSPIQQAKRGNYGKKQKKNLDRLKQL